MCTLHDFSVLKSNLFIRALLLDRILATEKTTRTPRVHLVKKGDSFFLNKKLASTLASTSENDAKFRFAIHPQGIRQFHDNCEIAKCQIVATLAPVYGIPSPLEELTNVKK